MNDPLLDHLRATAHDTAPEPGPALDPALVLSRGRRRRRTRYAAGAVAGVAAFAAAVAVGAPLLDRADGTTDPASSSSETAAVEPTDASGAATAVPATPPEPVDLGHDHVAAVGPGADGYLGAPGGVKVWLRSDGDADHVAVRVEYPSGLVWDFHDAPDPLEPRSREFFYPSHRIERFPDDPEGKDGPNHPEVTLGHLGQGGEPEPRAAIITSPTTAAELPLFQIPGSDRWFYVFYQGPGSELPDGSTVGRDHVVIRRADGTYEMTSCGSRGPDATCEVEESEQWMEDLAREVLQ